jgi:hypothetical protein
VTVPGRDFVTVVSGLPRSGTSLAMQMLAAGGIEPLTDRARTPDDNNPRGYLEYEPVKHLKADRAWFAGAKGRSVKIIHALLTELPDDVPCRVLFMRRDLGEVVRSQRVMLERSGRTGGGLTPERLVAVYEAQLAGVARWLAERPSFRVLDVPYADLVRAPEPVVATIDAFLGGGLDTGAMADAVDPDLYRNRG